MEVAEITPKDGVVQVVFREREGDASPVFPLTHRQAIWFVSLMLQAISTMENEKGYENKTSVSDPFFAIRRGDNNGVIVDFVRKEYLSELSMELDGPELLHLVRELMFVYNLIIK